MQRLSFMTRKDPITGEMLLPDGKRKIFISYKHSDEQVLPLCALLAEYILEALDVAIWYDHQLTAGKGYDEEIQNAISQSDAFLLLLTPNILYSDYVWEQELPLAMKQQVAIIPVIAGLSERDIAKVEGIIGRVHMPVWFFGAQERAPAFSRDPKDQLMNGLKMAIANKDLLEQARLFYEKGYQNVSLRNLTPEQMFVKAYGNLFGVDSASDKSMGIQLMESILSIYGSDKEFTDLQEQVSFELLRHFYRTNQPELFLPYLKSALNKGYDKVISLLYDAYRTQWHPELFCYEHELSMILLKTLYRNHYQQELNISEMIRGSNRVAVRKAPDRDSDQPHIGELIFDDHVAYFQKSGAEERTVKLIIDGQCVSTYDVYASYGDVYLLFMAYDAEHRALITLHADFDHYGPETCTKGEIYCFDGAEIEVGSFASDWVKGLRRLPYDPYTFHIKQ